MYCVIMINVTHISLVGWWAVVSSTHLCWRCHSLPTNEQCIIHDNLQHSEYDWRLFPENELTATRHWFIYWLGAVQVTGHCLNHCWHSSLDICEFSVISLYDRAIISLCTCIYFTQYMSIIVTSDFTRMSHVIFFNDKYSANEWGCPQNPIENKSTLV